MAWGYGSMNLNGPGDMVPCILMNRSAKSHPGYLYTIVGILNTEATKVILSMTPDEWGQNQHPAHTPVLPTSYILAG